jgi:AbrB family looped-hinge helix DNA binding protein
MATSTVTSKGQITIPKQIRDHLSLGTGDKVDFVITEQGTVEVQLLERPLEDLYGFLHRPEVPPISHEEINEAIREGRGKDDERIRGGDDGARLPQAGKPGLGGKR